MQIATFLSNESNKVRSETIAAIRALSEKVSQQNGQISQQSVQISELNTTIKTAVGIAAFLVTALGVVVAVLAYLRAL